MAIDLGSDLLELINFVSIQLFHNVAKTDLFKLVYCAHHKHFSSVIMNKSSPLYDSKFSGFLLTFIDLKQKAN